MTTITVRKDLTINTGNFTNVKIGAEITTDEMVWGKAWTELEYQLVEQESLVKATRIHGSGSAKPLKSDSPF